MAPSHQWGQNFLVDSSTLQAIADLVLQGCQGRVLEIGPGLGALTRTLLERGATVLAVELDGRVLPVLDALGEEFPGQLEVTYGDALTLSWTELVGAHGWQGVSVVGNLPYYITAPLLGKLLEEPLAWDRAVLMVQREVAERLVTDPGRRASSTLGVLLRYRADVIWGIDRVPPEHFIPAPEIFSSVIQLIAHPPLPVSWDAFRWVVRAGFQHRRKTLRQALAQAAGSPLSKNEWQHFLEALDISSMARAEALTLDQWVRLASAIPHRK
ncbi:ribosomal RNA small subunit methyltransferase A [Sulfobacillus sp. DSM 109850]|uniref:Ribosomal RNA small subunit methyltransferase A n=2 Tax=Sulfobacillus harzensis TaxID=2729629 RepID=A0A7Y0L6J4_9FIRM|nr:ribosomal RNA small subunit methyltransferase A [Sulfobacillus harzensis]